MRMRLENVCLPWKAFPSLPHPQNTAPLSELHCHIIIMPPFPTIDIAADFIRLQGMFSCLPLKKISQRKTFWNRNIKKAITEFRYKSSLFITKRMQLTVFVKTNKKAQKAKKEEEIICSVCSTRIFVLKTVLFQFSTYKYRSHEHRMYITAKKKLKKGHPVQNVSSKSHSHSIKS